MHCALAQNVEKLMMIEGSRTPYPRSFREEGQIEAPFARYLTQRLQMSFCGSNKSSRIPFFMMNIATLELMKVHWFVCFERSEFKLL